MLKNSNKMLLSSISIINFKNIKSENLNFSHKINCLIGNNGEGKTNVLDAIFYLSFCHSAFNSKDSDLITHGKDFFVLEGKYINNYNNNTSEDYIYCGLKRGQKKHFKRNKKEYKKLSQHIGLIPLIFISPADISVINGGSEERRKLMDIVISQYKHEYLDTLLKYNKALQNRNKLLKQEETIDETLIELLEMQMAEYGDAIFKARLNYIEKLTPIFQTIYSKITNENENITIDYVSHGQNGDLLKTIQESRAKDLIMGYSLHGIHKDDIIIKLNGYPLKKEGSQGQIKSMVIALKLAQFLFLKQATKQKAPLLLLDDLFDKLDALRVENLVKLVAGNDFGQIFITDTNKDHLTDIFKNHNLDYKIFTVDNGTIK